MKRILAFLLLTASALSQSFTLNDASTSPVGRIWFNLSQSNYYNTFPMKNLAGTVNPGMQPQQVRQIQNITSATTTSITTNNNYIATANAYVGYTYIVSCHGAQGSSPGTCAGGAAGATGTISANTASTGGGNVTYTLSNTITAPSANDTLWLISPTNATTPSGDFTTGNGWNRFGWQPDTTGSGAAAIDTTSGDLPPTLAGFATAKQCVKLTNPGSGDTAGVFGYFDTSGSLNYNFGGTFTQGLDVTVLSGTPTLEMWVDRSSSGLSATATTAALTGTWATRTVSWSAAEANTAPAGNARIGYRLHGAGSVCIVGATLTNNADNSTTVFRNQTVTNIQLMNPGGVRLHLDGFQGTTLDNWITPEKYRQQAFTVPPDVQNGPTLIGLQESLTGLVTLSVPRVSIVVPATWSTTDMSNLVDYLAGGAGTTYGARRIALGQTAAFTTLFNTIRIEIGNETWNNTLAYGFGSYPQYSSGPTAYWNYVTPAIANCQAAKANANWSSVLRCSASILTAQGSTHPGYFASADPSHYVDDLNANWYGMFTVTSCGIPNQYTSAAVESIANTNSGSASGWYQAVSAAASDSRGIFGYEGNNSTNAGSCTQAQLNGYPEGQFYGLVNTLTPLWSQKVFSNTPDMALWQYLQPTTNISTSGGATFLNEWGLFTGSGGAFKNPRGTAYAVGLVDSCIGTGNTAFAVTPSGVTTFNFSAANNVNSTSNVPYLQAFGFKTGSNRCLLVENVDQSNSYSFTVAGTNAPSGTITRTLYSSTNVNDTNEGANASLIVQNVQSSIGAGTYTIPAHSIVSLSWTTAATANVSVYTPPSTPSQPWFALPGFTHSHWAQVYTDQCTLGSWTINVSNIGTVTCPNNFSVADYVQGQNFTLSGGGQFNERVLPVQTATTASFTLNNFFSSATGGTDTGAVVHKLNGTQTGTWSWTNTGSTPTTATLTSWDGLRTSGSSTSPTLAGEQSFVNITFGATEGNCTESGTSGFYATTSIVKGDLTFTSDADATKTAVFPYVICASGGNSGKPAKVYIRGSAYRQAFKNDQVDLLADVWDNINQNIFWTITSTPASGDGTLEYSGFPEAIFHTGTVTGEYEFKACSAVDATACDTKVVYVAAQARAAANPDQTEQVPCENDSAVGFTVYRVGSGETYATPSAVPGNALTGPALIQIVNHGSPGSPETFHNFWQVFTPTSGGPFSAHKPAIVVCHVPNATSGEYAVHDGTNATGQSWVSQFTGAPATLFSFANPSANQYYVNNTPLPLNNVSVTNMHVQNVTFGIAFTDQTGNPSSWGDSSAVRFYNTEYGEDIGLWTYNVAIPVFLDANSANNNWGGGSLHVVHEGGNLQLAGANGRSTEHPIYTQGVDDTIRKMLIQGAVTGAQGTVCWASRAFRLYAEYNRCVSATGANGGSEMHIQGEIQNFPRYILATGSAGASYFGQVGDTSGESPYSHGDAWGPNGLAGLIELHNTSGILYGNTFFIQHGEKTYGTTNTNGIDNQIDGPSKSYVYHNTYALDGSTYFGHFAQGYAEETRLTSPGSGTPDPRPVVWPQVSLTNNIFPWTTNAGCSNQSSQLCYTMTSQDTDFIEFGAKNLFASGQMGLGTVTQGYQSGQYTSGMASDIVDMEYNIGTLNYRWKGFTSGNFATYTVYPISTSTYAPISGSSAIGIAGALTGIPALYPPRWNSVSATGVMTRRTDLTTVGGQDPPAAPPSTTTVKIGGNIKFSGNVVLH